jgi:hypothetical protein
MGMKGRQREGLVLEITTILKVGYFEVVVPGEERLREVAASSALFENELGGTREQMFDVVLGETILSVMSLVLMSC